jgi:hypothetical protein
VYASSSKNASFVRDLHPIQQSSVESSMFNAFTVFRWFFVGFWSKKISSKIIMMVQAAGEPSNLLGNKEAGTVRGSVGMGSIVSIKKEFNKNRRYQVYNCIEKVSELLCRARVKNQEAFCPLFKIYITVRLLNCKGNAICIMIHV